MFCPAALGAERIPQGGGTNLLRRGGESPGGFAPPPYCLSTATVSFQSLSDIHPSGFPAVFGVTHVSNDRSASRRDMAGTVASGTFLTTAAISSACARP